ncbi:MAG: 3-mercaptopyruvate sulfurtransferase [Paracoccaceae bacterium]|nr:3-mercaptopyruvate sulfurtransferase [Paracoccaceae bacterium]
MKEDARILVSTKWLAKRLENAEVRVLDASWYLPGMDRNPIIEYEKRHIPNARFFDIDDISDNRSDLPHMVPPIEKFMSKVRKLGVGDGHQVIVYDGSGMFSAARVWWLFKMMGHKNIAVLDGGLPKWISDGFPVNDKPPVIRDRHIMVDQISSYVKDVTQVAAASKLGDHEIVDARSPGRFRGEENEPRKGLRKGHIPNSKNVFFKSLLNEDQTLKNTTELKRVFYSAGVDMTKPVITTCGSGVSAAVLNLGLELIGKTDHSLYDGSWTEWGMSPALPVETGDKK